MADEMDLEQAHEFYKNPDNLVPAGPGRRPQRPAALNGTVPIRFPHDIITAVKRLADEDGMTVSSWIRKLVVSEVKRRQPPATRTIATPAIGVEIDDAQGSHSAADATQLELVGC